MDNNLEILNHIEIKNYSVFVNNNCVINFLEAENFNAFAKKMYEHLQIKYPKFYKMSAMCKLGFLASEFLIKDNDIAEVDKNKVAQILACKASSLKTDTEFQESLTSIPSPATFVYTLPNIVTGEICIRNGFKGEEMMFITESFDKELLFEYTKILFSENKADISLTGFIDYDEKNNYFASLYLLKNKSVKT